MHVALDEMADFAHIHFAPEEALLRLHGFRYLGLALSSIADAIRELDRTGKPSFYAEAGDKMVKFPQKWLFNRIGKNNRRLCPACEGSAWRHRRTSRNPVAGTTNQKKQEETDAQHQVV